MDSLVTKFDKDILIVETGYPWTLKNSDKFENWVKTKDQLLPGFPASKNGQKRFLEKLIATIKSVKNNRGIGMLYWAPEFYNIASYYSWNVWDNITQFDHSGKALPSMEVYKTQLTDSFKILGADISFIMQFEDKGFFWYK